MRLSSLSCRSSSCSNSRCTYSMARRHSRAMNSPPLTQPSRNTTRTLGDLVLGAAPLPARAATRARMAPIPAAGRPCVLPSWYYSPPSSRAASHCISCPPMLIAAESSAPGGERLRRAGDDWRCAARRARPPAHERRESEERIQAHGVCRPASNLIRCRCQLHPISSCPLTISSSGSACRMRTNSSCGTWMNKSAQKTHMRRP